MLYISNRIDLFLEPISIKVAMCHIDDSY